MHESGTDAAKIANALAIEFDLGKHKPDAEAEAALEQFRALKLSG